MTRLDALLAEGVAGFVFPTARAVVLHQGRVVFEGGPAPEETLFDLASLTKVMSTTALFLELARDGLLSADAPLRHFLPRATADVRLADLLFHRSGLPAFLPFFADVMKAHPALFEDDCSPDVRARARAEVLGRVQNVPVEGPARARAVYSDLGFILLGDVVERVGQAPLDHLFAERLARPLGLDAGFRRLSAGLALPPLLAPTGTSRPREPAPGQEGLWDVDPRPGRPGEVDDDNAWVMDGVAGHAGLFATAHAVARFGQAVLDAARVGKGPLAPPEPWGADAETPGSTRALGFDTPSAEGASCGSRFGKAGLKGAIGHLGFTGTSLWIDLDRAVVVALLTNRVHLGRQNVGIRAFRPRFHAAVLDALGLP